MSRKTLNRPPFLPGGGSDEVSVIRRELDDAKAEAADRWTQFAKHRDALIEKGSDPSKDKQAYRELADLGKAHEAVALKVDELEARWQEACRRQEDGGRPTPAPARARWGKAVPSGVDVKALVDGSFTLPPALDPDVLVLPSRARFLREIIPASLVKDTNRYSYLRQATRSNSAAPVAAGATKPTSAPAVERVEGEVTTIAHLSEPTDRALLEDMPSLRAFLDAEMRLGLLLAEDQQFLSGTGTAPQLRGILNTTGILDQALGVDTRSDAVQKAITQLRLGEVEPDAVVLHPSDWEDITLEKDTTGQYLHGPDSPVNAPARTIWGVGVLVTTAIPAGTGLVGNFAEGARIFVRETTRLDTTDSAGTLFETNQLLVRVEERVGFAVLQPFAFATLSGF